MEENKIEIVNQLKQNFILLKLKCNDLKEENNKLNFDYNNLKNLFEESKHKMHQFRR